MTRYTIKRLLKTVQFKTVIFCSKVPSKCRKCHFRDPKFKNVPGGMPPDPPTNPSTFGMDNVGGPWTFGTGAKGSTDEKSLGTTALIY